MDENQVRQAVLEAVEANWQAQVDFLADLVDQRSVLGNELGAQERVRTELEAMGLAPELYTFEPEQLQSERGFSPPDWDYRQRPNVRARLNGRGGGRSLLFNGHVDVVPATPEHHWQHDPWTATIKGDRLYGRGAADMKAGVTAMLYAVKAIRAAGIRLAGDVLLDTVIEEECTGNGTLASLATGSRADAVIIPEPFNQTVLTAQVGVIWARVTVRGQGAHVLGAEKAVNAIHKAQVLMDAIRELEEQVNSPAESHDLYRDLPHPLNYNVGTIRAGDWPSSVPAECTFEVRLSAFPGQDLDSVGARFEAHVLRAAAGDPWLRTNQPQIEFIAFRAEGFAADPAHGIFEAIDEAHGLIAGGTPERYISTATTDARFFTLYHGIPATCYGPVGGNLHAPDEWVDLPSVRQTTAVLALAALAWCGVSPE